MNLFLEKNNLSVLSFARKKENLLFFPSKIHLQFSEFFFSQQKQALACLSSTISVGKQTPTWHGNISNARSCVNPLNISARKIPGPTASPSSPPHLRRPTPTVTAAATPGQRDGRGLLQVAACGARRLRRRAQEGVPKVGHEVASGQESKQQEGGRGQVQADLRGVRGSRASPRDRPLSLPRRHCASDLRRCSEWVAKKRMGID